MNKKIISLLILLIIIMGVFIIENEKLNKKIILSDAQLVAKCEEQINDLGKVSDMQTESILKLRSLITSQTKTIKKLDEELDYEKNLNKQLVKKYLEVNK